MKKKVFPLILLIFSLTGSSLYAQEDVAQDEMLQTNTAQTESTEITTSQTEVTQRNSAKNEVSLNVLNVLVFGALDLSYERLISDHSSLAFEMFSKVFNKNEGEDVDLSKVYAKDFSLTTKFKYFLKEEKTAWGLYAEGFGMFSNGMNERDVTRQDPITGETEEIEVDLEFTDFALGIGVGGKFVAKQGFLIDVSFGLGRNLFHRDSPDIVIMPSVSAGYRF